MSNYLSQMYIVKSVSASLAEGVPNIENAPARPDPRLHHMDYARVWDLRTLLILGQRRDVSLPYYLHNLPCVFVTTRRTRPDYPQID
jgi:hypothetical protein